MKLVLALLFVFFIIVLGTDTILIFNELDAYRMYTKPLLMPILYVMLALETADTNHRRSKGIISLVLLFSFAGDLLLLNDKDRSYFTGGILCFLVAQVLYTIFFFKIKRPSLKSAVVLLVMSAIAFTYFYVLLNAVWDKVTEDNYNVLVTAYAVSIGVMFVSAVNTVTGKRVRRAGWKNFVPGALFLVISDSILALTNFYTFTGPHINNLIIALNGIAMGAYGVAQLLLITGATKFIKK